MLRREWETALRHKDKKDRDRGNGSGIAGKGKSDRPTETGQRKAARAQALDGCMMRVALLLVHG